MHYINQNRDKSNIWNGVRWEDWSRIHRNSSLDVTLGRRCLKIKVRYIFELEIVSAINFLKALIYTVTPRLPVELRTVISLWGCREFILHVWQRSKSGHNKHLFRSPINGDIPHPSHWTPLCISWVTYKKHYKISLL